MKDQDLKDLLLAVEEIARQAGAEIMKHYAGTAVHTKSDGSEVTAADHAAEKIILAGLKNLTPMMPIVSEERVEAGEIPDVSGGTFWTVDPLDGTREFINKTGAFVVAISLVIDNKPVLGVIYHPAMDLMYSGVAGMASKINGNAVRLPLSATDLIREDDMRVLVNEPHANMERVKGYLSKQFGAAAKVDAKSGILRACQVADGLADMAVVYAGKGEGRTKWWDVAPGHAIVEAAGGRLETLDGAPLRYDADDLSVPPHVVISPHRAQAPLKDKPAHK